MVIFAIKIYCTLSLMFGHTSNVYNDWCLTRTLLSAPSRCGARLSFSTVIVNGVASRDDLLGCLAVRRGKAAGSCLISDEETGWLQWLSAEISLIGLTFVSIVPNHKLNNALFIKTSKNDGKAIQNLLSLFNSCHDLILCVTKREIAHNAQPPAYTLKVVHWLLRYLLNKRKLAPSVKLVRHTCF